MTQPAKYDVAIVGAGPAGSSLAIRLATAGLSVALIERYQFPRDKLCGEFISPECRRHFDEIGVLDVITEEGSPITKTVFYAERGRKADIPSQWFGGPAVGLSRRRMDEILLEKAVAAGARLLAPVMATGVVEENGIVVGVRLSGTDPGAIPANITVDATGRARHLSVRTQERRPRSPAKQIAFKAHFRGAELEPGACEIYSYPGGYGGCNRVEGDRANLCFIVRADVVKRYSGDAARIVEDLVSRNVRAQKALREIETTGEWLAVPVDRYGRGEPTPGPGSIAIGDAAHFMDPFTGSGILTALESSRLAASAILAHWGSRPELIGQEYSRGHAAAFNRRLRFSSYVRKAAFSSKAASAVVALLDLSPDLRRRVALASRF